MRYRDVEKRLAELERDAYRAEYRRLDAWVKTLTFDELEAWIEQRRRTNPDAWAAAESMTFEEIEAELARRWEGGHVEY